MIKHAFEYIITLKNRRCKRLSSTVLITIDAFGIALAYINATTSMLHKLTKLSGPGVALSGALQMACSGIIIYLATFMHIDSAFGLGLASILCAVIGSVLLYFGKRTEINKVKSK